MLIENVRLLGYPAWPNPIPDIHIQFEHPLFIEFRFQLKYVCLQMVCVPHRLSTVALFWVLRK